MNVGFDLDGVLYDWHEAVYRECQVFEGYTGNFREFWTNEFPTFPPQKKLNFEICDPLFSRMVPSKNLLNFLHGVANKHNIFYITARKKEVEYTTVSFLERYDFPQKYNLIFSDDKTSVIRMNRISVFIDDMVHNVEEIGTVAKTFLVRKPWNECAVGKFNMIESVFDLGGLLL